LAIALAIAVAVGVVVDVGIDLAGAGGVFFGGRSLALGPLGVLLGGELGLLCAPRSRLRFLAQTRSLLSPLLDLASASEDGHDREQQDRGGNGYDDDPECAHAPPVPGRRTGKPSDPKVRAVIPFRRLVASAARMAAVRRE
jgi:hypothetical protein